MHSPRHDSPVRPRNVHNTAGVRIIVACTNADLINNNTDFASAGTYGWCGNEKGGDLEERTNGIMQNTYNLLQVYVHTTYRSFLIHMTWLVADSPNLFCTAPLPRTLNFLRQYVLHVLFVFPAPVPYGALDGTAAPNA